MPKNLHNIYFMVIFADVNKLIPPITNKEFALMVYLCRKI